MKTGGYALRDKEIWDILNTKGIDPNNFSASEMSKRRRYFHEFT